MKRLVNYLILPILFSTTSYAEENTEKQKMQLDFEQLNVQTDRCMKAGRRVIDRIDDNWFSSLPSSQHKNTVLFELRLLAMDRCVEEAERRYTHSVFKYTVLSGDESYLKAWLKFNQTFPSEEYSEIRSQLDNKQLRRLSLLPIFYYPFDGLKSSERLGID